MVDLVRLNALLQRYDDAESRIAANLIELDNDATFQLMKASTLTGVTRKRLGVAFDQSHLLWDWQRELSIVLAEARRLKEEAGWGTSKRHAKAWELLSQPSVLVSIEAPRTDPNDLLANHVPIERRVTIEALIQQMRETYEPISDGLGEVEARWRELLPRLDAAMATLRRCQADFDRLGIMDTNVRQLVALVEAARSDLSSDPLGTSVQVGDDLERQVAAQATRVADLRRGHDMLDDDLVAAEKLLAELRVIRARAAASYSEARAKISGVGTLARVPAPEAIDGPKGLSNRLDDFREGGDNTVDWQHRRQQLNGWIENANRLLAQLHRAEATNRAGLDRREDLRGLLSSYQAKAQSTGEANTPVFGDLTDAAHNELYTSPTDLDRAAKLVARVGATLRP